jgi:hypothetical protein
MMRRTLSILVSTILAITVIGVGAPHALADFPQHRITHFGPDGDLDPQAGFPDVAFNPKTREYLVVYEAGSATDEDHWTIFGQRIRAGGKPVGHRIRVSSPSARQLNSYEPPAVLYARNINQFLVTWDEGTPSDSDDAIYVRRISGSGKPFGEHAKRISDRGYGDIETTVPAYNPQRREWMVAWNAEGPDELGGFQELWAQRLNVKAQEVGVDDRQLTDHDTDDFDSNVTGDEAFGHLMNAKGAPIGPAQFRISHVTDTNATGEARPPTVSYDPVRNRFLVVWTGNPQLGSMDPNEIDIFGRFVKADGSLVGGSDRRFSDVGTDGDPDLMPVRPDIEFNPFLEQFLFAWSGDNDTGGGVDEESEVWGQRVGVDGSLISGVGFRISHSGPEGDPNFAANRPALAFDGSRCRYLAVWSSGDVGNWGDEFQEWEIYGNFVSSQCPRG